MILVERTTNDVLQKFYLECVDVQGRYLQYVQESRDGKGLKSVELPFNFNKFAPQQLKFRLYKSAQRMEEFVDEPEFLKALVKNSKDEEFLARRDADDFLSELPSDYFQQAKDDQKSFPLIEYSDVTEHDMFGYPPLNESELRAPEKGIWGNMGYRKFRISVKDLNLPKDAFEPKRRLSLYWYKADALDTGYMFEEELRFNENDGAFYAYIDTNQLEEKIRELRQSLSSNKPRFNGRFEIHDTYHDETRIYTFPIEVIVHDTDYEVASKSGLMMNRGKPVSIDFGTSATCAAIHSDRAGVKELLTLSGEEKQEPDSSDNPYENPTNLLIYHWDEVYNQWQAANDNCPFFQTLSKTGDEMNADYDSGYTVEKEYADVDAPDGRRKMAAILTELKSVPYFLSHGKEIKFTPYYDSQTLILVTDSLDDMSDRRFNPIAFYGYLLSRAINMPGRNKIYTFYQVTFPVKFKKEVKEKIRAALEYGILRALPKSIRDAKNRKGEPVVQVSMDFQEPVACVGSIVGKGNLQLSDASPESKLFAIYDLGGGTMDFSFGLFRKATEEELDEAEENDEDIQDNIIEILGIGGDENVGGEKLIHSLAYKIYKDNRALMEQNRIKFVLPREELMPDGFNGLLDEVGDEIADANVSIMKEQLARILFKYQFKGDENRYNMKDIFPNCKVADIFEPILLRAPDGSDVELALKVSGVEDFLNSAIEKTVKAFKTEMTRYFNDRWDRLVAAGISSFRIDDVNIFLSGNASKQQFVIEKLQEIFPNNNIVRIGEGETSDDIGKMFRLNEKTAVAFGQLELGNYTVIKTAIEHSDEMPPFLYNVGYIDNAAGGKYVPLLFKNDVNKNWQRANKINAASGTTDLCFTAGPDPENDTSSLLRLQEDISDFVEKGKHTLYIRIYEEDSIEFRVDSRKHMPDDNEPPNPNMVLILRDRRA